MPLNFQVLIPEIDQILAKIEIEARKVPAWILTEDDLKCILFNELSNIPMLRQTSATQDIHILGRAVHAEVSWYGEPDGKGHWLLAIKPDITIVEPEHLGILHDYIQSPLLMGRPTPFARRNRERIEQRVSHPPLPSKRFEFGGKAITFELKFARSGITPVMMKHIQADFDQIELLFRILDNRGEGDRIYSYLVIFNKHGISQPSGRFAEFLIQNGYSHRHKIVYKTIEVKKLLRAAK